MLLDARSVGEFIVESHVGQGRYASVVMASLPNDPKKYVIKIQNKDMIAKVNPLFIKRELKTYRKIKDIDGVPNLIHFCEDLENAYFIFEFIDGYHLQRDIIEREDFKKGKPMTIDVKKDILLQTIKIIRTLHSHGIYHGDLKLENVLVDNDGKVHVIDFGCSIISDSPYKEVNWAILGTPGLGPPEISLNSRESLTILENIDVWALCNIFYYMFTRNFAFGNVSVAVTITRLKDCDYIKDNVHPNVLKICDRVFRKIPEERATLNEFEEMIREFTLD